MSHYTYMLTVKSPEDSRRLYIGVRSCKGEPEQDVKYMGSCKPLKEWMKTQPEDSVEKMILARWPSRTEALEHEILLHDCFDVGRNQEFWNRAKQRTKLFDTTGIPSWSKGLKLPPERVEFMRQISIGNTNRRGKKHTDEAKEKNRLAHIGKAYHCTPHTEESKKKMSASKIGMRSSISTEFKPGEPSWNKGMSPSMETRKKISETLKLRNAQRMQNV